MTYDTYTGTNGSNTITFGGINASYNQTMVNPYTGYTVTVSGTKHINNTIYDGLGGEDKINMTIGADVLTITDAYGAVMVSNVEEFNAGPEGDIISLAHSTITYGSVTIRAAEGDDIIWTNLGNDIITSGQGNDIVDGGGGNDFILGGTVALALPPLLSLIV